MHPSVSVRALVLSLLMCSVAGRGSAAEGVPDLNLKPFVEAGEDWAEMSRGGDAESGHVLMHHDVWAMFFLHRRPLTEKRKKLSVAAARKIMLNLWGPNMPFTLSGEQGETEVNGHRAVFVEGTLGKGMIRTRFIVWNCPQTGRQFIADTNINLKRGTPASVLELQRAMTRTVACHGAPITPNVAGLEQRYESKEMGFSYSHPAHWLTRSFDYPKWYPDGQSKTTGSTWTLMTDAFRNVGLSWETDDGAVDAKHLEARLRSLFDGRRASDGAAIEVRSVRLEHSQRSGACLKGRGVIELAFKSRERTETLAHPFRAVMWRHAGRTFVLVASMEATTEVFGLPNDLTPSPQVMDAFMQSRVVPAARGLPGFSGCE